SGSARRGRSDGAILGHRARWTVATAGASLIALVAAISGSDGVASDRRTMHERYESHDHASAVAVTEFRAALRAMILRHPADPYFPLLGAAEASRAHDQSVMPWMQRTLERGAVN